MPQLFRPVCQLRPAVRQLAASGEQLSPGWAGKKVTTELKSFGELKEWHGPGRRGALSFRRGAARAILEGGGSCPRLHRAGQ